MKRVFTDEIKEEMLTSFELLSNRDEIFSDEMDEAKIAVYEIISDEPYFGEDEMNEEYKKILEHYIYLNDNLSYNRAMLDEVFNTVRQDDGDYKARQIKQRSESLDYLNESLKIIVEGIKITKVTEQAIKKIGVDEKGSELGHTEFGGLFGDVTDFSDIMAKAGDGMTSPVYSKIYHDGKPDWDEIDRLMKEGATWYEVVALSQLVDSYRQTDKEGKLSIDKPGFEEFVNHCFLEKGENKFLGEKRYDVSETLVKLAIYRQKITDERLKTGLQLWDDPEIKNEMKYVSFVSDAFMMLATEYNNDVIVKDGIGNNVVSLEFDDKYSFCKIKVINQPDYIIIDNDNKEDITVYFLVGEPSTLFSKAERESELSKIKDSDKVVVQNGARKIAGLLEKITIGNFKKSWRKGVGNYLEDGKRKVFTVDNYYTARDTIQGKFDFDYELNDDDNVLEKITGLNKYRKECEAENDNIIKKAMQLNELIYLHVAGANYTICQCGDQVIINNVSVNKNELSNRLAYFENVTGTHISVEEYIGYLNDLTAGILVDDDPRMEEFEYFICDKRIAIGDNEEYKQFCKDREDSIEEN